MRKNNPLTPEQLEEKIILGNAEPDEIRKYSHMVNAQIEKNEHLLETTKNEYFKLDKDSADKANDLLVTIAEIKEEIRNNNNKLELTKPKPKINNKQIAGNTIAFNGSVNIRPSKSNAVNYITKEQKERDNKA